MHYVPGPACTYPLRRYARTECLGHKLVNLPPGSRRQIVRRGIIFELELGPDHQMDDAEVDAVGPVIIKNLIILCKNAGMRISLSDETITTHLPAHSNGLPFGQRSFRLPSPQRSRSLTTKFITDPYFALICVVYSRYFLRSLGTRCKRSIRFVPAVDPGERAEFQYHCLVHNHMARSKRLRRRSLVELALPHAGCTH